MFEQEPVSINILTNRFQNKDIFFFWRSALRVEQHDENGVWAAGIVMKFIFTGMLEISGEQ